MTNCKLLIARIAAFGLESIRISTIRNAFRFRTSLIDWKKITYTFYRTKCQFYTKFILCIILSKESTCHNLQLYTLLVIISLVHVSILHDTYTLRHILTIRIQRIFVHVLIDSTKVSLRGEILLIFLSVCKLSFICFADVDHRLALLSSEKRST